MMSRGDDLQDLGAVPVTQSGDSLEDLGAVPMNQGQPSGGFMNFIKGNLQDTANDFGSLEQGVLGAGDALRNTIASGANLIPGVKIPMAQTGQGTAYNVGKIAGNVGGFIGGGEALDAARLGAAGLPYIGQSASALSDIPGATGMASWLPGVARRALGASAYGAASTNDNRLQNAAMGLVLSPVADAVPGISNQINKGIQYLQPQKYADSIISSLGGGQSLEDATKSVLSDVKNGYNTEVQNAKNAYDPVFSSVPNSSIYAPANQNLSGRMAGTANFSGMPSAGNESDAIPSPTLLNSANENMATPPPISNSLGGGLYPSLPSDITDEYTKGLKSLHNTFMNNPTFQNAHNLQSELGSVSSRLKNGVQAATPATIDTADTLMDARTALKSDINDFLTNLNTSNHF